MPGWIGPWEIAVVAVVALIVFGPKRLPELGSSLGRAITGFKKGLKETEDEVRDAVAENQRPNRLKIGRVRRRRIRRRRAETTRARRSNSAGSVLLIGGIALSGVYEFSGRDS